jgi:5-methylcytosine-specific restriction protein B
MSHADDVREHCRVHYVEPARSRGESTVIIRAGDVHSALGYKNHPLVCSALGAATFEESCGVERVAVNGPLNGANTVFTFRFR